MFRLPPTAASSLSLGLHALAVFWLGLMAGFFWTYSANVNFATLQMDGSTYALVQSSLNRNVRHAMFFSFFFGPPVLCALAVLAAWPARRERWNTANLWRAVVSAATFALALLALCVRANRPHG